MTDTNLGENKFGWFTAIVTNVYDPDQSGRLQIRVYGRHDDTINIPDSALPWAQVHQATDSASVGKIGSPSVGAVKGTKVMGYWADSDHQNPVITATIGKAGDVTAGETVGGTPSINTSTGSSPVAGKTGTLDYNPYSTMYPQRQGVMQIDNQPSSSNLTIDLPISNNVTDPSGISTPVAVEQKMKIPNAPTTASLDKNSKPDVLTGIQQVDPSGISASLPNMVGAYSTIQSIMNLISPIGVSSLLQGTLTLALTQVAASFGLPLVLGAVSGAFATGLLASELAQPLSYSLSSVLLNAANNNGTVIVANTTPVYSNGTPSGPIALANAIFSALPINYSQPYTYTNKWTNVHDVVTNNIAIKLANGFIIDTVLTTTLPNPDLLAPSPIVTIVPENYVQVPYTADADPYPGYIQWTDNLVNHWLTVNGVLFDNPSLGNILYTLRNGQPYFISPSDAIMTPTAQVMVNNLIPTIQTAGVLDPAILVAEIALAAATIPTMGISSVLGNGINLNNIVNFASILLPAIGSNILGMITNQFPQSVLNVGSMTTTMSNFTQNQALLLMQMNAMQTALQPTSSQLDASLSLALQSYLTSQQPYTIPASNVDYVPVSAVTTNNVRGYTTSPSGTVAVEQAIAQIVGPNAPFFSWNNRWLAKNGIVTNNITINYANGTSVSTVLTTVVPAPTANIGSTLTITGPSGTDLIVSALLP